MGYLIVRCHDGSYTVVADLLIQDAALIRLARARSTELATFVDALVYLERTVGPCAQHWPPSDHDCENDVRRFSRA